MSSVSERKKLLKTMREMSTNAIMMHQTIADNMDLSITDYKCLDILVRFGPMSAGKLTKLCGLTTGAVTGVIDRLEKKGYVRRTNNPEDRRSVIVELSWDKKNIGSYERVMLPLEQKMNKMSAAYTDKELLFFMEFMNKVINILHQEAEERSVI